MVTIIGIDPGLDGGIVCINEKKEILYKYITPTIPGKKSKRQYDILSMRSILNDYKPDMVILESQQAMPKQGVSSMFRIGMGYGIWQGLITGLGYPMTIVHPKTWQKLILNDIDKTDTKQAARIVSQRLYPEIDLKATDRCKNPHEGMIDALLLADYGLRLGGKII